MRSFKPASNDNRRSDSVTFLRMQRCHAHGWNGVLDDLSTGRSKQISFTCIAGQTRTQGGGLGAGPGPSDRAGVPGAATSDRAAIDHKTSAFAEQLDPDSHGICAN
ncbi:MAG: hypothetical protein H7306_03255 [Bacteriovorax sp.]|nr:hypothetical protein [Rhizobacter sp.]